MRAVTRVNTEQASKCRCRCRPATITGKAEVLAEVSGVSQETYRGSGDSTYGRDQMGNKGSPCGCPVAPDNGDPVRDGVGADGDGGWARSSVEAG